MGSIPYKDVEAYTEAVLGNAVLYARYSSRAQNDQSIEGQLEDCYKYAKRCGYRVVGEYIDRATSGKTDEREHFQRLMADAKKGQFQYIIVWKLDRFARNRYDSAMYKNKLKKLGVKVLSATEQISDSPEGIILEGVLEAVAEYHSANHAQNVKRGQKQNAEKGLTLGGVPPIGYKVVEKQFVVDKRTAPIIKHAFEQYAAGVSKRDIVDELNQRGIRNQRGKPLTYTSFQHALRNPKYKGVNYVQALGVEAPCPAIVDEATWDKVQRRLDENRRAGAKNKAKIKYLLQGKLFCGYCGSTMAGESGRGRAGQKYYYYACRNKKIHHTCHKKNEKKDFLEWYVVEQTVEYVLTPKRIDKIAARVVEIYNDEFGNNTLDKMEHQLATLEVDISRLVDSILDAPPTAVNSITKKIGDLEAQKQELEIDLAKLRIANKISLTKEEIKAYLQQFCQGDLFDEDFRIRIIDTFINAIFLYDDKVVIYYNLKDGKQVSYIEMLENIEEGPFDEDFEPPVGVRISNGQANH